MSSSTSGSTGGNAAPRPGRLVALAMGIGGVLAATHLATSRADAAGPVDVAASVPTPAARDHAFRGGDSQPSTSGFSVLPLEMRRRIFFKYEKRIREMGSLEKVFDYFASQEKDGVKYMMPGDLIRAVAPTYPPRASTTERAGSLDGERSAGVAGVAAADVAVELAERNLFQQFDTDGDGLLSFPEYITMLTLLSIPEADVNTIFELVDLDSSGQISVDEFASVMEMLQARAGVQVGAARSGKALLQERSARHSLRLKGVFQSFFGDAGTQNLSLPQFRSFLGLLHQEVVRLEFGHYDSQSSGTISGIDFATSLVASADIRQIDGYLDKVQCLPDELASVSISFEDFDAICSLRRNLHKLAVALDFYVQISGAVGKADFAKLVSKMTHPSLSLRPAVVDILFALFGQPGADAAAAEPAALDVAAFVDVFTRRENMPIRKARSSLAGDGDAALGRLGHYFGCLRQCWQPSDALLQVPAATTA